MPIDQTKRLAPSSAIVLAHALGLAAAVLSGCSTPPKPVQLELPVAFGEAWEGFADIADRSGYRIDPNASDRGMRVFVSRWLERPAPFGKGNRTRVHGKFVRDERDGEFWRLEFWVERQVVKDISRGFEPEDPDWSAAGQDGNREEIMLGQLRLRFGKELGITPGSRTGGG
jgi:hypothetical protein